MNQMLHLAWRNMWRNWRRTVIALIAIVIGVIALLFFDGTIKGSDQAIFGNAVRLYGGNLQIHATGYRAKVSRLPLLPLDDTPAVLSTVRSLPAVSGAASRITTAGVATNHGTSQAVVITAIDPASEQPFSLQAQHIVQGHFFATSDHNSILIGQALAQHLNIGVGDSVALLGRRKNESMRQHSMTVVGIFDLGMPEYEKSAVFIPLTDAQTLYNLRDQSTEVAVFLQNVNSEDQVHLALQQALPQYEVDTWKTLRPEISESLTTKLAFSNMIGFILLLIASIGILNLMMMAVFERTREMGVLAALGMKGWQITTLFLLEGGLIGLAGALFGCLIGSVLIWSVNRVGIDLSSASGMGEVSILMGSRLYLTVTAADLLNRAILVVVVATLASLYPAWQAARNEPAVALHHV